MFSGSGEVMDQTLDSAKQEMVRMRRQLDEEIGASFEDPFPKSAHPQGFTRFSPEDMESEMSPGAKKVERELFQAISERERFDTAQVEESVELYWFQRRSQERQKGDADEVFQSRIIQIAEQNSSEDFSEGMAHLSMNRRRIVQSMYLEETEESKKYRITHANVPGLEKYFGGPEDILAFDDDKEFLRIDGRLAQRGVVDGELGYYTRNEEGAYERIRLEEGMVIEVASREDLSEDETQYAQEHLQEVQQVDSKETFYKSARAVSVYQEERKQQNLETIGGVSGQQIVEERKEEKIERGDLSPVSQFENEYGVKLIDGKNVGETLEGNVEGIPVVVNKKQRQIAPGNKDIDHRFFEIPLDDKGAIRSVQMMGIYLSDEDRGQIFKQKELEGRQEGRRLEQTRLVRALAALNSHMDRPLTVKEVDEVRNAFDRYGSLENFWRAHGCMEGAKLRTDLVTQNRQKIWDDIHNTEIA